MCRASSDTERPHRGDFCSSGTGCLALPSLGLCSGTDGDGALSPGDREDPWELRFCCAPRRQHLRAGRAQDRAPTGLAIPAPAVVTRRKHLVIAEDGNKKAAAVSQLCPPPDEGPKWQIDCEISSEKKPKTIIFSRLILVRCGSGNSSAKRQAGVCFSQPLLFPPLLLSRVLCHYTCSAPPPPPPPLPRPVQVLTLPETHGQIPQWNLWVPLPALPGSPGAGRARPLGSGPFGGLPSNAEHPPRAPASRGRPSGAGTGLHF